MLPGREIHLGYSWGIYWIRNCENPNYHTWPHNYVRILGRLFVSIIISPVEASHSRSSSSSSNPVNPRDMFAISRTSFHLSFPSVPASRPFVHSHRSNRGRRREEQATTIYYDFHPAPRNLKLKDPLRTNRSGWLQRPITRKLSY